MTLKSLPTITVFIFCLFVSSVSHADYFVWQDEKTGVSLSYPDTWYLSHNQKPRDILTLVAPNDFADHPTCRLSAVPDARFEIFPPNYYRSVQKVAYSKAFWEKEILKHYKKPNVVQYGDNAGLGRGFGSYIIIDYVTHRHPNDIGDFEEKEMRAITTVSLHNEMMFMFECTSHRENFDIWRPLFQSIAGSVDFKMVDHPLFHGYYRNFIHD